MKKLSKVLGYVLNILILFIIIIMAFAIYYFVQVKVLNKAYANIFGYTFFEVATGSMSPTINAGDVIFLLPLIAQNFDNMPVMICFF